MNLTLGIKNIRLIWLAILFATTYAQAGTLGKLQNYSNHIEVSGAGGADWYQVPNTDVVISSVETDRDRINQISTHGAWKIGGGYYLFENTLKQREYFNHLLAELNVYQTSTTLRGDVWQFKLPQFNNYNFRAPVTSTRLMFDMKPNFLTWRKLSPYAILGIGATWNTVSYHETATGAGVSSASALSLSNHTTAQLAWDVGAGFRRQVTEHLNFTAEYIYAFLGHGAPAHDPIHEVSLNAVPRFSLQAQSLLLGLSLKL